MVKAAAIQNKIEKIKVEFTEPVHSLWLKADFKENLGAMVLLYNPSMQLCGTLSLGFSRFINELYISETVCTLNGLYHELQSGVYTLMILPLYDLQQESAEIIVNAEINITKTYEKEYCQLKPAKDEISFTAVTEETSRYYKGDFHGHTIFSDGHNSLKEASAILKDKGMDFMAFTEHNSMAFGRADLPCLSIPSFELTLPIGHVNIHGVRNIALFYEQPVGNSEETLDQTLDVFSLGSNLSLNHMFMEPWHFTYGEFDLSRLNTIEVICDPTYETAPEANAKAVAFLDFLWNRGYRIYGIGGSDSHNKIDEYYEGSKEPSIYGDPATYVFCKGLSVQNVLDGIRNGHCYTARYVTLDLCIGGGKYLPGDLISEDEKEITYEISIKNINKPFKGCFFMNSKIIKEVLLKKDQDSVSFTIHNSGEPWWLRFGIYDMQGQVIAYVNPVYHKVVQPDKADYKNLLKEFGERYDQRYIV